MSGLIELGAAAGSKSEQLKERSNYLRGTIAASLAQGGSRFSEDDLQLLKFHGSYQQENRDERATRKAAGLEKAYSFMVRSRIPGGVLTSAQYLAHDEIAQHYGSGSIRLTTRQSIQLHGVLKGDLRAAIKGINDSLLSTLAACGDVNRNVMACPAPLPGAPHAQASALAHELALRLAPQTRGYHELWIDGQRAEHAPDDEPMYGPTYLPRKFKIGVALENDNCVDVYTQDIAFVAHVEGSAIGGYTVLIGGGMGSTHGKSETYPRLATPLCFIPPNQAVEIAKAILTVQRDYGDRTDRRHARMKYVVEERGTPWFLARVQERLGRVLAPPRPVVFPAAEDHLGWHRQSDGSWFLGISVLSGRVADLAQRRVASALREIASTIAPAMRITPQQNLLLTGLSSDVRSNVEAVLARHSVEVDPARLGLARYALACPALPTCGLAVAEAERALPALLAEVQEILAEFDLADEALTMRMTGCPNGCARPRMGDIGIVGRSLDIYDVFVGGDRPNSRMNALYAQGVRRAALAATLHPLLDLWRRERIVAESFGDYCHRVGVDALKERSSEAAVSA